MPVQIPNFLWGTAVSFFYLASVGCSSPSDDWEVAVEMDTAESYQTFLERHADSIYAEEATGRIQEIAWGEAVVEDSIESYRLFIEAHGESAFVADARNRISVITESLAFESAQNLGTVESYEEYVEQFPNGRFVEDARQAIEAERIRRARELALQNIAQRILARDEFSSLDDWPDNLAGLLEYVAAPPRSRSRPGRAALEEISAEMVRANGPGDRFRLDDIQATPRTSDDEQSEAWRYSIESAEDGITLTPSTWKDIIPIGMGRGQVIPNNIGVVTTGRIGRINLLEDTIWRIPSRLMLPTGHVIEGDPDLPISFLVTGDHGLVYLAGYGRVLDTEGFTLFEAQR